MHLVRNCEGHSISPDFADRDSARVTGNARAARCTGLGFLRSGYSISAVFVDQVVWTGSIDRFPTSEGGGMVCCVRAVSDYTLYSWEEV